MECAVLRERFGSDKSTAIVRTGVGPVNAAHAVTLFLARTGARAVVVCGVGGAYPGSGLAIGDVVCAESECYGDLGAMSPVGLSRHESSWIPDCRRARGPSSTKFPCSFFHSIAGFRFVTVTSCTGTDSHARAIEARTRRRRGEHGRRSGGPRGVSSRHSRRRSARHQQHRHGSRYADLASERGRSRGTGGSPIVDRAALNFAFSSCPNDTFAFHALVHGLVPGPRVVAHIDDVEALNARAEQGGRGNDEDFNRGLRPDTRSVCASARRWSGWVWCGADRRGPRTRPYRRARRDTRRTHDRSVAAEPAGPFRDRRNAIRSNRRSCAERGNVTAAC